MSVVDWSAGQTDCGMGGDWGSTRNISYPASAYQDQGRKEGAKLYVACKTGRAISEQGGGRARRPNVREQHHCRGLEEPRGVEQGGQGELGQQGRNPFPDPGTWWREWGGQCHHWGAGSPSREVVGGWQERQLRAPRAALLQQDS
jgi:hypothetical protein